MTKSKSAVTVPLFARYGDEFMPVGTMRVPVSIKAPDAPLTGHGVVIESNTARLLKRLQTRGMSIDKDYLGLAVRDALTVPREDEDDDE